MSNQKTLRRGQVVNVHGPGAIVDIGDESFTVCGIDSWKPQGTQNCPLPRLARRLRVGSLKQPKSRGGFNQTPTSICLLRFPRWMFCQKCRKMIFWTESDEERLREGESPSCQCGGKLVPMRFVQICENGHLDDINWNYWVHRPEEGGGGPMQCVGSKDLHFRTSTRGGSGLGSLKIECKACGMSKNLQQLVKPNALGKCHPDGAHYGGRQPWQRKGEGQPCDVHVRVVQRGDSNLHYPRTISALDIPESNGGSQAQSRAETLAEFGGHDTIKFLQGLSANGRDTSDLMSMFAEQQQIDLDIVEELVLGLAHDQPASEPAGDEEVILRREEYPLLVDPVGRGSINFSGTRYRPAESAFGVLLARSLESISLMHRLREVRVFQGFHRVKPGGADRLVPASISGAANWLPASEVFGEGIFFQFHRERLSDWVSSLPQLEIMRFKTLGERIIEQGIAFLPDPHPELILLHGFAHILMRQLCFECGYAASSLRERLYVDGDEMTGVLIYTADGDSEGTLGGLVRQGEPDRLPAVILRALHASSWCSGDPLCRESENQGLAGLNRAACHACLLVSETSCELANALLDRRLLVGDDQGMKGFFSDALEESGVR